LGINFTAIDTTSSAYFSPKLTQRSRVSAQGAGEMFKTKKLSQLLQNLSNMVICDMSLITLLRPISTQTTIQVSGFAGISTKCASARHITQ
jgi:hypothetical protein